MTPDESETQRVRERAEQRALQRRRPGPLAPVEAERLLHELEVHQIELEMQNDELRSAQAELEASRARYADLYDFAPVGYFSFDAEGVILEGNLTGAGMLGIERLWLLRKPFSLFVAEPDRDLFRAHLQTLLESHQPATVELRLLAREPGKERRYVQLQSVYFQDAAGKGFCRGALIDMTSRRQAESALRASEERYRLLVEGVTDYAIFMLDAAGRIASWNAAAEAITGYRSDQILGQDLAVFYDREEAARAAPQGDLGRAVSLGRSESAGWRVRADGTRFWVDIVMSPLRDAAGQLIGYTVLMRDLTERRRLEEEVVNASKLESIGMLAGGIAHDFNNVLTAISGNIFLVKQSLSPDDRNHRILADAERAAVRAKSLTQQLLTFSTGGAPVKRAISLATTLREAVSFGLSGSNVRCDVSIPDDLWPIEADQGQLRQVIHNLVINAKQAMPHGGALKVDADNVRTAHGDEVRLRFKDEGVGISAEDLKKIFDPFFTTKPGGSGLGLTTAHAIVKKHGGRLVVNAKAGKGASFYVYLPRSRDAAALDPAREEATPIGLGSGRVLLMDDDAAIRELAVAALEQLGFAAETAADGVEAIERYLKARDQGRPFDAVILDLTVPGGMGGEEAVKRLHAVAPDARVIVSSGYSNDPVMANYRDHGFLDVVAKPYDFQDLNRVLQRVIKGSPSDS